MVKPRIALVALPLLALTACGQQTQASSQAAAPASSPVSSCGQHLSGASDPNRLAVYRVPVAKDSVGVFFRGTQSGDVLRVYLTDKNNTVIGTASQPPVNGQATIDTLCAGTTWAQVTASDDFDDQVTVVLTRNGQGDVISSEPLYVKAL
ncbi:hypothetical protein [Kitasatospora sp. GP82]|uniref:hypothetical protein n=1 Tax=Kitasatospora sp. GP82 TaxID=3035089 RepID=UPI0024771653|nr:hypothetical protein [Kitasatospora sp. GP82]MDH6129203.1 hypothetical protein [Kitasatospora sp. GP82]